jgi:hypothetical protein
LQKIATNKAKAYVFFGIALLLASVVWVLLFGWYNFESVSANPDYICVKNVSNLPCMINENLTCSEDVSSNIKHSQRCCDPWDVISKSKICYGQRYTKQAYHSVRMDCESWYTQIYFGDSSGDTGRQAFDSGYGDLSNCGVTITDEREPVPSD